MTSEVLKWCKVGYYIDARDNMNEWCIAEVKELTKTSVKIMMLEWAPKCEVVLPLKSPKIAPFRKMSRCSAGPRLRNYRLNELTHTSLEVIHEKLKQALNNNLLLEDAFMTTQFFRGRLFLFTESFFASRNNNESVSSIVEFSLDVLKMIEKWIRSCKQLFPYFYLSTGQNDLYLEDNLTALACSWHEIIEVFKRLIGIDNKFGDLFSQIDLPVDVMRSLPACGDNRSKWSKFFIDKFTDSGGFDLVLDLVQNEDEKSRVPFCFLNAFPVYEIIERLDCPRLREFSFSFNRAVLKRLEIISDSELKDLKHEEIVNLLGRLKKFRALEGNLNIEQMKISFFFKMLKSNYLEKRIKGLSEINSAIEALDNRWSYDQQKNKYNSDELKNWLFHEDTLKTLLQDRPHIELIKRAGVVLKFYAKCHLLDNSELFHLWESIKSKHDSYIRASYEVLIDLSAVLNEQQNDFLFSEFKKVPQSQYDEAFVAMVKEFSVKAIATAKKSINFNSQGKIYGVELFKDLLLANLGEEMNYLAIKSLVHIVSEDISNNIKTECLKLAKLLIKTKELTLLGIILYLKITKKAIRSVSDANDFSIIREILSLGNCVLDNLAQYLDGRGEVGKVEKNHKVIFYYLRFLGQPCERTMDCLGQGNLDKLWQLFQDKPTCERSIFFSWLSQMNKYKLNINPNQISYIFRTFYLDNDRFSYKCNSLIEYISFNFYFLEYNRQEGNLELTESRAIKFRHSKKIKGMLKLIQIYIYTEDELVIEKSGKLFFACISRFDSFIIHEAKSIVNEMTGNLMRMIEENRENEAVVTRILMLIQVMIDKFDDEAEPNCTFYVKRNNKDCSIIKVNQFKTLRSIRKELAKIFNKPLENIGFMSSDKKFLVSEDDFEVSKLRIGYIEPIFVHEPLVTERLPFKTLKKNQALIDLLFDLVSDLCKTYTDIAWKLLLYLPICKSLEKSLSLLEDPVDKLIDSTSTYKLLYELNIICSKSSDDDWVDKFINIGGSDFIVKIFVNKEKHLPIRLKAKKEFGVISVLSEILRNIEDPDNFIKALFKTFKIFAKSVVKCEKTEYDPCFFDYLEKLLDLVRISDDSVFSNFIGGNSITQLIKYSIIDSPSPSFVESSFKIINQIRSLSGCLEPLFIQIYSLLDYALNHANLTSGYWNLLSILIKDTNNLDLVIKTVPVLIENLKTHQPETSSSHKDEVLCGLLQVLHSSLDRCLIPFDKSDFSLILHDCLCDFPQASTAAQGIPKCKHPETRSHGFDLVVKACEQDSSLVSMLVQTLDPLHEDPSWRSSKKSGWGHSPVTKEKSSTGFVGLKNLGCTCYMNSILQQLYMIESFRSGILSAPSPSPSLSSEDNLLYQLQYIFTGLKESDKQYITTKNFAKAFKDQEGNEINVVEQMDVDEFFGSFMDKLENLLKPSPQADLIKVHFGGVQVTELIGKECPHRSEREEPFLSISVEVKNKKTLIEGLESYVEEELLEGENSYQCDHCESKVKAIRRVCVKYLPNFLILALRRFEFDFDSMTREKLNDYFEFQEELDMEKFTQEGLENERLRPKDYYLYGLRGIVIHAGTAEIGHYYSYIYHEGTWVEFNDIWVGLVNPQNIANDCFGGEEKFQYPYNRISARERQGNAYMLIYERKTKYRPSDSNEDGIELIPDQLSTPIPKEIQEIRNQNRKYWINKITFGLEYIQFFVKLSKLNQIPGKFLIKFFLTVLIRSKERKYELFEIFNRIESEINQDTNLADWVLDLISHEKVCKELLLFNPVIYMRKFVVAIAKAALSRVDSEMTEIFFTNLVQNLRYAHRKHSRHFCQYLELVKESLIKLSKAELQQKYLETILCFIFNKPYTLPGTLPHRNSDTSLGYVEGQEEPKEHVFHSEFYSSSYFELYNLVNSLRDLLPEQLKEFLVSESSINHLISDSDYALTGQYIGSLLFYLASQGYSSPSTVLKQLLDNLKSSDAFFKTKSMSTIFGFMSAADGQVEEITNKLIEVLSQHMKEIKQQADFEIYINLLVYLSRNVKNFSSSLSKRLEILQSLEVVFKNHINSINRSIVPDELARTNLKSSIGKIESLYKDLYTPQGETRNIEVGAEVEISDGNLSCDGKVVAKAGDLLLVMVSAGVNSFPSFEIRDRVLDEIMVKHSKHCS